ncbi:putative imidazolonepropionase [Saccoglossus kowalevskii]|uniref:Probable imidazolonepropionase n=1 Tax=Saccoglossus kowalevskii TaxID=10224 RepID=A0ABM0H1V9_SACKO|nr:PREDICTED: probable imidazolonepropionase-like [Saccoglossus kowalevskii]
MTDSKKLLIEHFKQAVLVCRNGEKVLKGDDMKNVALMEEDGDNGISIVIDSNGLIEAVDYDAKIQEKYNNTKFDNKINAKGKCVVPGLIDGHTHPVWVGDRVHEFAMKLAGATYMDVHKAGGGINFTVEHTRSASEDELFLPFKERLERMLHCGTTLVECKSGYGLNVSTEIKMLKVIERAKRELPIDISSTFCGAHAVPKGKTAEEATEDVISVQLPQIVELMKNGELQVDNIDVFCEKGVFNTEQTKKILNAGVEAGLAINFHGDELHPTKSAELGAELNAAAISHLEEISDDGIVAMASSGTIAVLLPTTAYILRLKHPPARKMIESGVAIALGTDFNPNAFCLSMPLTMHLACVNLHMSMNESLVAATINAAASLNKSDTHGSLEVGKVGDLVIIDAPKWEHLVYQLAGHGHVIKHVVKKGNIVYTKP